MDQKNISTNEKAKQPSTQDEQQQFEQTQKQKSPEPKKEEGTDSTTDNGPTPHKPPYQQQQPGVDQNTIPAHTGRIPDETREDVEEKSKDIEAEK